MPQCSRDRMFDEIKERLDKGATKMTLLFWLGMVGLAIEVVKGIVQWMA